MLSSKLRLVLFFIVVILELFSSALQGSFFLELSLLQSMSQTLSAESTSEGLISLEIQSPGRVL